LKTLRRKIAKFLAKFAQKNGSFAPQVFGLLKVISLLAVLRNIQAN
jgi:hypothetical protein